MLNEHGRTRLEVRAAAVRDQMPAAVPGLADCAMLLRNAPSCAACYCAMLRFCLDAAPRCAPRRVPERCTKHAVLRCACCR